MNLSFGYLEIPDISSLIDVSEAVKPESWFLFKVAGVDGDFLDKLFHEWVDQDSYTKLKDFIINMLVVNDVGERGVKLIQEYGDSARGEDLSQDILTVSKEKQQNHEQGMLLFMICQSSFIIYFQTY